MKLTKLTLIFIFLLAFAVSVSAQDNPYPNELEGFEFFGKGKLKGFQLGVSTKEEVKNIFGTSIDEFNASELYDYDVNWLIRFTYFDEKHTMSEISYLDKGKKVSKLFLPEPEFLGKIRSIRFTAKPSAQNNQLSFSENFNRQSRNERRYATSDECSENCLVTRNDYYQDSYGLKYTVFDKVIYNILGMKLLRNKGDLIAIEYKILNEKEKIFVEQK